MTDRELLEKAARAAGLSFDAERSIDGWLYCTPWMPLLECEPTSDGGFWSSLRNDGDALRLAVRLRIDIEFDFDRIDAFWQGRLMATEYLYSAPTPTDPYAATRRAIARAAAAIGEGMK